MFKACFFIENDVNFPVYRVTKKYHDTLRSIKGSSLKLALTYLSCFKFTYNIRMLRLLGLENDCILSQLRVYRGKQKNDTFWSIKRIF